eukprot:UN14417
MNADCCVSCPTVALAQILQDTQPVWLYEFTLDNNANSRRRNNQRFPYSWNNQSTNALLRKTCKFDT